MKTIDDYIAIIRDCGYIYIQCRNGPICCKSHALAEHMIRKGEY